MLFGSRGSWWNCLCCFSGFLRHGDFPLKKWRNSLHALSSHHMLMVSGPFDLWQIWISSLEESNSQSYYQFITSNLRYGQFVSIKATDKGKNMEWIPFIFSLLLFFQTFDVNKRKTMRLAGKFQLLVPHNHQDTFIKHPANLPHSSVLTCRLGAP